jgi:hydroxymethylbilane synthase
MTVRLATRESPLARWQAEHMAALLRAAHPGLQVELVPMTTEGDRRTDVPLSEIGGKGVFVKEVSAAVLDGRADVAVHSAKDLPALTAEGLVLAAVPSRGDARDALVGCRLQDLPTDGVVATGSARRRAQLARLRPDLRFQDLRGNMATRLAQTDSVDAIVVAAVALERLGLADRLTDVLPVGLMVPQVGQGALALECRTDDTATRELLAALEDPADRRRVDAERAFLAELGGDCTLPAGAHALPGAAGDGDALVLRAVLSDGAGRTEQHLSSGDDPDTLGREAARGLRELLGLEA